MLNAIRHNLLHPVAAALLAVFPIGCADGKQSLATSPESQGGTGGAGAASQTGGSNPNVVIAGATNGGASLDPSCAAATFSAALRPLTLYILLDQSGSMKEEGDRWTPVTDAIRAFVNAPESEGVRVALQYFALGESDEEKCDADTYAAPEVNAELPAGVAEVEGSLSAHDFPASECCSNDNVHSGTPTRPAVEGATRWLDAWLTANPEQAVALLLATDGNPSEVCDGDGAEDVTAAISSAASMAARTYVIGIGHEENLQDWAEAGGSGTPPFIVDGTGDRTELEFLDALRTIRGSALACDYAVPEGPRTDRDRVNVQYGSAASGQPVTLLRVSAAEDCDPAVAGWYYVDVTGEPRIQLCPQTCTEVSADARGRVDIVVGCATRVY
jgi:hypothetical protein